LQSLGSGITSLLATQSVSGLTPGQQYHFRVAATNDSGLTRGLDQSFWVLSFTNAFTRQGGVFGGTVAWGDYDRDGFLDLLVSGYNGSNSITALYRSGAGAITCVESQFGCCLDYYCPLPGSTYGSGAWGDFNNDGASDVLLTGYYGLVYGPTNGIHWNDSGTFTNVTANLPGFGQSAAACADYDNDGLLDFVAVGITNSAYPPVGGVDLFHNNGDRTFSFVPSSLPPVFDGAVAWGDFDNDGQLDLAIMGNTGTTNITRIYRNDHGVFTDIGANLPGVCCGSLAWGDYDNDGQLDLLVVGQTTTDRNSAICRVFHNDHGVFTDIFASLPSLAAGRGAWGDFDGDGFLDIVLIGFDNSSPPPMPSPTGQDRARIFRNDHGDFVDIQAGLTGAAGGAVACGDFDNDGRLDVAVLSDSQYGYGSLMVFRNLLPQAATNPFVPFSPSGLSSLVLNNGVLLRWTAGNDAHTPTNGLTYNVRVGTTSGGGQIVSPQSDPLTGRARLPQMGNAGHRLFSSVTNLPVGLYYWSVQTINNSFAASAWAPEQTFAVTSGLPAAVTLPASNVLCCSAFLEGSVIPGGLTTRGWFDWGATTNFGNTTPPLDLSAGVVPQSIQQGLTNLSPLTTYYFRVNASNNVGLVSGTNQTFTTFGPPPVAATLAASNVSYATALLTGQSPFSSPPANYFIQWGLTTNYGNQAAAKVLGAAMQFDGLHADVAVGWGKFPQVTNNFTIELWADPATNRVVTTESISGGGGTSGQRYAVFPEQGSIAYGSSNYAGAGLSIGTNGVSVMEHSDNYLPSVLVFTNGVSGWTHVALVYTNHLPILLLNGIPAHTGLVSGKIVHPSASLGGATNNPFGGGQDYGQVFGQFEGSLQEVRVWGVPLDANTIQAWMNQSLTTNHPAYSHLQGYWPLNEGQGLTATDLSASGNNGQLLNGAAWTSGRGFNALIFGATVSGLMPGTTYHFRAVAVNPGGTAYGEGQTLTTLPRPQTISVNEQSGPACHLRFSGLPGANYSLEVSTNLLLWTALSNLVAGSDGQFEFLDTTATNIAARFYRLRVQ